MVSAAVGFGYLHITKIKAPEQAKANPVEPAPAAQPAYTQAPVQQEAPVYTQPPVVEDMDSLLAAVLNAIRPQLKAPMTAVLCEREQMSITNNNSEYDIRGFVNSQNSYGAMIATDFAVKARYYNGSWVISKVTVGKLAAKNYAKTFLSNYIAISIFVGIMGLLGYLLLTLIIG